MLAGTSQNLGRVWKGKGTMSFITRAFASMTRNFGKTILLLLIVFILGIVISGAISVQQAILNTDANLRANLGAVATVELDNDLLEEYINRTGEFPEIENFISLDLFHQIGALPYVRNYDVSAMAQLSSEELTRFSVDPEDEYDYAEDDVFALIERGGGNWTSFDLKGVQNENAVDVSEGIIEITSGRMFTAEELSRLSYLAVISEELANLNNLHVGSSFTLVDIIWDSTAWDLGEFGEDQILTQRSYEFEVIGIFNPLAEFDIDDEMSDQRWMKEEIVNRIYVPNSIAIASQVFQSEQFLLQHPDQDWAIGNPEEDIWLQNVYFLHDPQDMDNFRTAVEDIAPDFYTALEPVSGLDGIASSMDTINGLATMILIVAATASVIILSLLITLFVRERRQEIGIYLALGEKRAKVIAQMMLEVLTIALLAIILALFVGNLLAGGLSEAMLRNDMAAATPNYDDWAMWCPLEHLGFGADEITAEEALAAYNVSLDLTTVGLFFASAIGTVVIATIIPMLYIVRLNPKKIML